MAKSIEQYNRVLADMSEMAKRAKTQILELQNQIERGVASGNVSGDLSRQIDQARELTRAYRELESERARLVNSSLSNQYNSAVKLQSAYGDMDTSRLSAQYNQAIKLEQAYKQLDATRSKAIGSTIRHPEGRSVTDSMPATSAGISGIESIDPKFRASIEKANSVMKNMGAIITSVSSVDQELAGTVANMKAKRLDSVGSIPKDFRLFVDEMGNWGKTIEELGRMQFVNDPKNKPLLSAAERAGYGPEHFRSMSTEGNGAYSIANFRKSQAGVDYSQSFRVDQGGGISGAPVKKQSQSFAQGIGKDLGDLVKWSVAIGAIYGPLNAITKAIGNLIENESKLADVSIAVNDGVAKTGQIFDAVYESAKQSGEGVAGVIDAFGQAYQAAGRVENEFQRYDAAIKLTNDSLTLSKLSTLDQAGAIDVLTAALYQTAPAGTEAANAFDRGGELLDQWVRVSKIASVSVETLATGVAVLGDSAETAGLDMEHLNALVATISETSLSSGKETANIAKALIGNYQQEGAVKELNRLGIAVTDVNGKTREFLDVMNDVAALRKSGILGDQDFGRLTLALGGGGIRRQKDVSALIENWDRMNQIANSQDNVGGESQTALAKKLETVQTASTRLDNAFTSLAQTMGEEGGLLTAFTDTINLGTTLVEIMDKMASGAGKVTPLLLALGAATLLMRGKDATQLLSTNVTGPLTNYLGFGNGQGLAEMITGQRNLLGKKTGTGAFSTFGTLPTLAAIAAPAISNFRSGDTEEGIADMIGGAFGAIAGGPAGALVGAAIAEAFVRTTITYDVQFADFFAGTIKKGVDGASTTSEGKTTEQLTKEAFQSIGYGNEYLGKYIAKMEQFASTQAGKVAAGGFLNKLLPQNEYSTEGSAAFSILQKGDPKLVAEMRARYAAKGETISGEVAPIDKIQKSLYDRNSGMLSGMQKSQQDKLQEQLIKGDLKPSDYANRMASLSAFTITATRQMAALVGEAGKLPEEFNTTKDAYGAFLDIASSGNQELINQINQQSEAIAYYELQLKNWQPGTEITNKLTGTLFTPENKGQIQQLLDDARSSYGSSVAFGQQQVRLQQLKIPEVYGGNVTPTASSSDVDKVVAATRKVQDRKYSDLDPRDYQALKDSWEPFKVLVEESGKIFYKEITGGIDKALFGENFQAMQESGQISSASNGLGFTQMDITKPQLNQAVVKANALTKQLEGKGYKSNVEDILIATSDEQITKQHVDMKILQYIMQQMLDTEKKQLEGIYNLPEGATAMVPYSAALLAPGAGIGGEFGEGGFGLKDPSIYAPTAETKYSQTPGEELSTLGYDSTSSLLDSINKAVNSSISQTENKRYGSMGEKPVIGSESSAGSTDDTSTIMSVLSQFIENLKGVLMPQQGTLNGGMKGGENLASVRGSAAAQPTTTEVSTKLDLKLTSTTQLMVDGRVLASIVKPYLAADLLKTNESGGTVTRSYVI